MPIRIGDDSDWKKLRTGSVIDIGKEACHSPFGKVALGVLKRLAKDAQGDKSAGFGPICSVHGVDGHSFNQGSLSSPPGSNEVRSFDSGPSEALPFLRSTQFYFTGIPQEFLLLVHRDYPLSNTFWSSLKHKKK
ncbi:hypothetical protein NE237_001563 [Protea cynaroides]|uniref:Uncharacterized protein n=1 Tax=Protea cynaroides TaxID=273540 RepID=A0A9Q0KTK2_9MAGN|nr:hypothetical protein NE237_001563 [Protea cynaroides]